ncbi:MAG TPA: TlpA disulfide reductase family protein [Candidatus Acidoferrales bacterium]|nr:TlpA disulfide reductase family protein [Candidatus Acidoferrales bacterium]
MKKTALVVLTLVALVGATYLADRRWSASSKRSGKAEASVPATVPPVVLKDLDGHDLTLDQFKGKVVLMNFWATWCEPCRVEIPWMIEFEKKYGPRGFIVLGVAMDDGGKKVVWPFVKNERFDVDGQPTAINYPIVLGNDDIADKFGGIIGLPTSVLISRDGKKVRTIIGLVNHDQIVHLIESQL